MEGENSENNSRIERLKRGLYSRKNPNIIDLENAETAEEKGVEIPSDWKKKENDRFDKLVGKIAKPLEKGKKYANKIFTASIFFFLASVAIAAFVFFGGINLISSRNVDIKVIGPVSVPGGQEVSLEAVVINSNRTDLQSVFLSVEYPKGVMAVQEGSEIKEIINQKFDLGVIKTGDRKSQILKTFIFGEKDEVKDIKLSVEYKVKNSNATFFKEKIHQVSISSSPLIVTPTYLKEVNSNQNINFNIEIASNSKETMEDFLLILDYPFGFTFKNSSPKPSSGSKIWLISGLKPSEKRTVEIEGNIVGQDGEERVFRISTGTPSEEDEREISTLLTYSEESVFVKRPFLGIDLSLNGDKGDYIYQRGDLEGSLIIRNNLPDKIFDSTVEVAFSGEGFSEKNVRASQGGFFRSIDDTILWDNRAVPEFRELDPQKEIKLSFSFTPASYQSIYGGAPEIILKVTAKGERILESGAVEKIESAAQRKIRFATNLSLTQRIVRSQGKIENYGPIPPRAEEKTAYTVIWSLTNSFNNASNVEVSAVLPPYVEWSGLKDPADENIIFDPATNKVTWIVPQVLEGTGYGSSPKEAMFQIIFTPSRSQVGAEPELLGKASLFGTDKVTGVSLTDDAPAVSSRFSSDPTFRSGDEKVIE